MFFYTLKYHDILESNVVKRGIAIVKLTAHKSSCKSCKSFGDRNRHTPANMANTAKVKNVINASTTLLGNMLSKNTLLSKVTPKFRAEAAGVKFSLVYWLTEICD